MRVRMLRITMILSLLDQSMWNHWEMKKELVSYLREKLSQMILNKGSLEIAISWHLLHALLSIQIGSKNCLLIINITNMAFMEWYLILMDANMKLLLMIIFHAENGAKIWNLNFHKEMGLNFGLSFWKKHGLKYMVHMTELFLVMFIQPWEIWQEHQDFMFIQFKIKRIYLTNCWIGIKKVIWCQQAFIIKTITKWKNGDS